MTDPRDPRQQDRGYYGAGWQQPAPGPSGHAPSAPRQRRARADDPRRAFAPGASLQNTTGALIAVVSVVVVQFLSGLVGLIGASFVVNPFATSGLGGSLVGGFVHGVFTAPLPFHVGAFLALAFLVPVARRSPLPVILLRAVLAGAAGTVALALVGVATGAFAAARGAGAARLVTSIVTAPLQSGLPLTLMLVATTTAAWLWLGRPRGGARRTLGGPGTLRQPDAVPAATVQGAAAQHAHTTVQGAAAQQHTVVPAGGEWQQPSAPHAVQPRPYSTQPQPRPYSAQPQPGSQSGSSEPPAGHPWPVGQQPQAGPPAQPAEQQQPPANPWAPPPR